MKLANNSHLAYCTNIHRGSSWAETLDSLDRYTMKVRDRVCPDDEYAIGLRLSASAARQLSDSATLLEFQRWLEKRKCYVFTINGFPYGDFHGTRVKEEVYRPDWTSSDRVDYTKSLFDLLCQIAPPGMEGSVSTVPGSFKRFISSEDQLVAMRKNLAECALHIDALSSKSGRDLHLGLEPEPLCLFETSAETVSFFDALLAAEVGDKDVLLKRLGVNYDACHLAVEYETAEESLGRLVDAGIRISKIHLSSALKVSDFSESTLKTLGGFCEEVYLHQVVARTGADPLVRYEDLDVALAARASGEDRADEWRIHFHIPLHSSPGAPLESTSDQISSVLDIVKGSPDMCRHFEMETYTWEVLPGGLGAVDVVDQLVREYEWTLGEFNARGLLR
ncbi:MAG: metabolite traffic protein EboE [Opitutaceae bacterium]|nr:metabolite traffic protein EboE [Opitutaceae bacterium]